MLAQIDMDKATLTLILTEKLNVTDQSIDQYSNVKIKTISRMLEDNLRGVTHMSQQLSHESQALTVINQFNHVTKAKGEVSTKLISHVSFINYLEEGHSGLRKLVA